jgi:hypothetical protein
MAYLQHIHMARYLGKENLSLWERFSLPRPARPLAFPREERSYGQPTPEAELFTCQAWPRGNRIPGMAGWLRTPIAIGALACATLASQRVWSQPEDEAAAFSVTADRIEAGFFAGTHFFASNHGLGRYANDPHALSPANGFAFGGRLTWNMIPRLAVEVDLLASPTETRDGATS